MNRKNIQQNRSQGGYIIILNVVFFLAISTALVAAIISPLVSDSQTAKGSLKSTRAFMAGNSAAEESLYRLKNSYALPAYEELVLGAATATIAVSSSGSDQKTIQVNTEYSDYFRNFEIEASAGAGVNFNYGLQSGRGGFIMSGGATINGNVYSNGNIVGSGGPVITGSAFVANQSDPVAHVTNGSVFPPTQEIAFGGNATPQDFAQSFQVSTTTEVTSVRLYIMRTTTGWMNDINMYLVADNSGKPAKTKIDTVTIGTSQITTSYNYISVPFSSAVSLTPGDTYWLVFDTSTTWGAHYAIAASSTSYADGMGQTGTWANGSGGTWTDTSPAGLDAYFDLFIGGETGLIDGITIGQSGGDAWAYEVNDSYIYNDLYCQASSNNNQACDTSRPDPSEQPYPISDGNIADWKAEAESGGIIVGDVTYGSSDVDSIGPTKIEGDLSVTAGAILNVTGTLYVTGDVSVSGGGIIQLDNSYGSNPGVIVSDGLVSMGGGGVFQGNGLPDSYVLVLTTSDCHSTTCGSDYAITVSGGTDSVILNAQQGGVVFSGGASANQVTAYEVVMSGGTTVNYISGLADVNFSSGPSGSWTIDSWEEI